MHLFELEDFAWFPAVLRDGGTAYLALAARAGDHARHIVPIVRRALATSSEPRLVDLCSGGGGPIAGVVARLADDGHATRAVLTDLYPNLACFSRVSSASGGRIDYCRDS